MHDRTFMTRIDLVAYETQSEEERQDARWGKQDHRDGTGPTDQNLSDRAAADAATKRAFDAGVGTWLLILREEVAEVAAEEDPKRLKEELTQVAAVAQQWIRAIERRG